VFFRDSFEVPKYDDAPYLSDQLLLPNMAEGYDLHLFSAFAPSYLFRLVADLAASPEVEPGFLNIVFFVPGDLKLRSRGIVRFRNYLTKYAASEIEVANFVDNVLQLHLEGQETGVGGISITLLHSNQKRPIAKGCMGIISAPEETDDYVAFFDARGGDFNSPVKPLRSWLDDEFLDAESVFQKVSSASNGQVANSHLLSGTETLEWFAHLSDFYEQNPPSEPAPNVQEGESEDPEEDSDIDEEEDDELLEYLLELPEYQSEESYGYFTEDELDEDSRYFTPERRVEVSYSQLEYGHIPPLPTSIRDLVGQVVATCPCGLEVNRAYGCDAIDWNFN
jgi:hypothetical protein